MPKFVSRADYFGDASYPGSVAKPQRGKLYDSLQVAGVLTGVNRAIVTATATLTLEQCGPLPVDASAGNIVLTLPASGVNADEAAYDFVRNDANSNDLTLLCPGADTIDDEPSLTVPSGASVQIKLPAGSTNWQILAISARRPASQTFNAATTAGPAPDYEVVLVPANDEPTQACLTFHAANAGAASTLAFGAGTPKDLKQYNSVGAKVDPVIVLGQVGVVIDDGADYLLVNPLPVDGPVSVRQTVLEGPVDANGYAAFGGSVGTATLTATGTLKVTAAAGGERNHTGSITNPAWPAPGGSGTGYLNCSVSNAGVVTPIVRILPRVEQYGGAYSTTSGQLTLNYQEATMKAGNGATADQVFEVPIGECAFTAGVWSGTPKWYNLKSEYVSGYTTPLPGAGTSVTKNHDLGTIHCRGGFRIKCLTSQVNFAVGEIENAPWTQGGVSNSSVISPSFNTPNSMRIVTGSSLAVGIFDRSSGAGSSATTGSWAYEMWAIRPWGRS